MINTETQVEATVRCSIVFLGGNDSARLSAYLHRLGEMRLSSDFETIVVNDQRLKIDEKQLRRFLPALKVLNTDGLSTEKQLFDSGAMAAEGRFLLLVRGFINFDKLILEESIGDLETCGGKVSISANKNFVLVERLYYTSVGGSAELFRTLGLATGRDASKLTTLNEKKGKKHGKVMRHVAKFGSCETGQFYRYEAKLATMPIVAFIGKYSDRCRGKLVDVGCGSKPYKKYFSHINEYIGVDLTSGKADIVADAKLLPIESNSVDIVLCTQVIEHDAEPIKIIAEIRRVLKEDGILILSAPQMGRLHGEPNDYYRFTKWGLSYLLGGNHLKIEVIEPHGGVFRAIGSHLNFFIIEYFGKNKPGRYILRRTIIALNNFIFSFLDKLITWDKDTLGYNIIAKKGGR